MSVYSLQHGALGGSLIRYSLLSIHQMEPLGSEFFVEQLLSYATQNVMWTSASRLFKEIWNYGLTQLNESVVLKFHVFISSTHAVAFRKSINAFV